MKVPVSSWRRKELLCDDMETGKRNSNNKKRKDGIKDGKYSTD
jgi:hypothetical protein